MLFTKRGGPIDELSVPQNARYHEPWGEYSARIAKKFWGAGLIWLLLGSAIVSVVTLWGWFSADHSSLEHRICPECQRLLEEYGVKLAIPELAGCDDQIHAARHLKSKSVR